MSISAKLAADLLAMAIRFSGLPGMPADQLPFFEPMTTAQLGMQVCPYVMTKCDGIVSAYNHEDYVVIYLDTLNVEDVVDSSFLVHELVHVLQHHAHIVPKPLTCEALKRMEIQAYSAQNAYLKHMGSSLRYGRTAESTTCESMLDKY